MPSKSDPAAAIAEPFGTAVPRAAQGSSASGDTAPDGTGGGQTIFHPDDEVQMGYLRIACGTCQDPYDLEVAERREEGAGDAQVSAYTYRCSNPRCSARVVLRVFCGTGGEPKDVLPTSATGEPAPEQTIFHEDDGLALGRVTVSCGTCKGGALLPRAKDLEEVETGTWTLYTYHHQTGLHQEACPVRVVLKVPHGETLSALDR